MVGQRHKNCEIFPEGYNKNVFRKDRNKNGGGVFISVHDRFNTVTVESGENDCELQWTEVQTKKKTVLIGSFYRLPNAKIDSLENLQSSMTNINEHNKEKPNFLAGDFNLPHIDWENNALKSGGQSAHSQKLLEIAEEFAMDQIQTKPTHEENNLDLFFTNYPSLVKSCNVIPGILDHDMVVTDIELKPQYNKPKRRETFRLKNAKWSDIKSFISSKGEDIIQNKHSVEEKWQELKECINKTLSINVPKKMTSKRHNLAWLTKTEKKLISKKHKLFLRAKQSGSKELWKKYKLHKRKTQRAVRLAHWTYVNSVLNSSLESGNTKPFWTYVKSKRNDNIGVSGLKKGGIL